MTDSDICRNNWFDVSNGQTVDTGAKNVGFGWLKILSDDEIGAIRNFITQARTNNGVSFGQLMRNIEDKMKERGIELRDDRKLNVGQYRLNVPKLKMKNSCKTDVKDAVYYTNCDVIQGNSGGPVFKDNTLLGVVSSAFAINKNYLQSWGYDLTALAPGKNFYTALSNAKAESASMNKPPKTEAPSDNAGASATASMPASTPAPAPTPAPVPASPAAQSNVANNNASQTGTPNTPAKEEEVITHLEQQVSAQEQRISQEVENLDGMNDAQFINFLGSVAEYDAARKTLQELKEQAAAAKAKEQSFENRMLGAAAIGATGLGAMTAASAMAEQSADAAAEQDMKAYLQTFTCDYSGSPQRYKLNEMNIELPGGDDMLPLYMEYVTLANNLKERKEALGMLPGIESEAILDSAASGLYDDVGTGITGGAYVSLSRAMMDPEGEDAAAWAAQKSDTASKLKTGAIIAGAGAVGGAVGNILLNRDSKSKKDTKSVEDIVKKVKSEVKKDEPKPAGTEQEKKDKNASCEKYSDTTGAGNFPNCTCRADGAKFMHTGTYESAPKCVCEDANTELNDAGTECVCRIKSDDAKKAANACKCIDGASPDKNNVCQCNADTPNYSSDKNACVAASSAPASTGTNTQYKFNTSFDAKLGTTPSALGNITAPGLSAPTLTPPSVMPRNFNMKTF